MIDAEPLSHRLYGLPPPVQHQPTQIQTALGPLVRGNDANTPATKASNSTRTAAISSSRKKRN